MYDKWEFQDPKMEVLYHIRPYFVVIFPYIGLKICLIYGRYLQSIGSWNSHIDMMKAELMLPKGAYF